MRFVMAMSQDRDTDDERRIVAVGLLTQREVTMLGAQLSRLYPLEDGGPFVDLIDAIDEADRDYHLKANVHSG